MRVPRGPRQEPRQSRAIDTGALRRGAMAFNSTKVADAVRSSYTGTGVPGHLIVAGWPHSFGYWAPLGLRGRLAKVTALRRACPAHLFEAAKEMMFADSFARTDQEHMRMLDSLYETVIAESAPRSVPPPRMPSFSPR